VPKFINTPIGWTLITTAQIGAFVVVLLLSLAFLLYADRKIWAGVQLRKGPNVVGPFGLLQSFADFLKFALKEVVIPAGSDKVVFLLAPFLTFLLAFIAWAVIPVAPGWVVSDLNVGILYLFAVSSLGRLRHHHGRLGVELEVRLPGLAPLARQMVSYEVSIGFVIITVILWPGR
jgi:NADH-quinone oxidoreductase subunit H